MLSRGGAGAPLTRAQRLARGGLALLGVLLLASNLRAALTVVGPLVPQLQRDTGLSSLEVTNLVTIPVLCFAMVSPLAPLLAARLGLERALGLAVAGATVGILLRSFPPAPNLWLGTVLLGSSIAVLNVLLPAIVRRDYATRISQITGWYQVTQTVFAGLAAACAVPIAGSSDHGWRLAFGITAALGLLAFAVFLPRVVSPLPYGGPLGALPGTSSAQRSPWKTSVGWQVSMFMGFQSSLFYTAITWFPSIELDLGVAQATAGAHQGYFQACGMIGSMWGSWLFARTRHSQVVPMAAMVPLGGLAVLGLLLLPQFSLGWICLAGFACGIHIVFAIALMGLRASNHHQTARLSGMAQAVGYAIAGVVPLVFGALHDITGGWQWSLWLLAGTQVFQMINGVLAARARQI